jgi:hypothetical protein
LVGQSVVVVVVVVIIYDDDDDDDDDDDNDTVNQYSYNRTPNVVLSAHHRLEHHCNKAKAKAKAKANMRLLMMTASVVGWGNKVSKAAGAGAKANNALLTNNECPFEALRVCWCLLIAGLCHISVHSEVALPTNHGNEFTTCR